MKELFNKSSSPTDFFFNHCDILSIDHKSDDVLLDCKKNNLFFNIIFFLEL